MTHKIVILPYQSGKKSYRIKVQRNGVRKEYNFKTMSEANAFNDYVDKVGIQKAEEDYYQQKYNENDSGRGRNRGVTVEKLVINYANNRKNITNTYRKSIISIAQRLGKLGSMPCSQVTPEDYNHWIDELAKTENTGKTIQTKHGLVSSAFKQAIKEGHLRYNPAVGANLPQVLMKEMNTLTKGEYEILLHFIHPHYRLFVETAVYTGLRFGEITALTPGDIDFEKNTIRIAKAYGDGGKVLKEPKTRAGIRTIAIRSSLTEELRQHARGLEKHELLFTTITEKRICTVNFGSRIWQPAIKMANGERENVPRWVEKEAPEILGLPTIDKKIRFHDLRHTAVTWMIGAQIPIYLISKQLGHKSIETTIQRYGHIVPTDYTTISESMERFFNENDKI